MSNVRSLQRLIRVTPRVNTSASCHSSRVLPHAPFQLMPLEVTASQSVEVLCVNTSALLIGFAQQGPVHGAFAHMAGSSRSQFMKGASRRRAAPGSRPVEVAARAATCPPATRWSSQEKDREVQHRAWSAFTCPSTRGTPQSQVPKACGLPPPCASAAPPPMARHRRRRRNKPTPAPLRVRSGVQNRRHRPRAFVKSRRSGKENSCALPRSDLTLPSSGQSKGCAFRLPLMSNVGRHKENVSESYETRLCS